MIEDHITPKPPKKPSRIFAKNFKCCVSAVSKPRCSGRSSTPTYPASPTADHASKKNRPSY